MQRAEQLKKLSREHHVSLKKKKKYSDLAETGSEADFIEAIKELNEYNDKDLELHFQHEERTIFAVIFKNYKEHIPLATPLLKEHGIMRLLIPQITPESAKQDFAVLGEILKDHTRVEERELFPIIEKTFTNEELNAILDFKPPE